ncbi:tRNA/helicase-type nucleic acid-binding protein [Methanoculleus sediminis]|uniref:tRNA/helicase-type nucleic acid-binding protein n=1 Tax=Methanoculleus sediminis TaxID=1550566 RepID=A0A0H1R0H6_9EURY|nr:tRNA/helicase-type nucleic acid-binding protein [Methanoculleus sediminis]KLK88574.1 tRNA/helicase-type nucleic acid-binding protein [Methanoculleus sediminis]
MKPQSAFEREPARRVFASELRETRYQFKDGEDEKSPTYVILPTGIRSNRIFIAGTLTEKQRQGDQNIFYRGRVVDPTGTFFIMAGSYQPEAMQQLARIEPPAFVAVVGKPNLYTTPDGNCLVSVRVESVAVVDRETRDLWVLDTARETLDRLDAFGTTDDSRKAQEEYGTQPDVYKKIVYDALTQVQL